MLSLNQLLEKAHGLHASDVHLVCGLPAKCRIDGAVTDLTEDALTAADCELFARELAGDGYEAMASIGELDMARTFPGIARTRVNLFRQQGCVSAAIRLLSDHIPSLEALSLPPAVAGFAAYRSGIVLVTGETGSGKSTTLAALLDRINHTRPGHIITLEDPIEYIARALSPAQVLMVSINEEEKNAKVIVPDEKLSLAIGRSGQNARLAAKLTGWKIDVKPYSTLKMDEQETQGE